jgi:hypothetical protein
MHLAERRARTQSTLLIAIARVHSVQLVDEDDLE